MSSGSVGRRIGVPRLDPTTVVIVCGDSEVASWPLVRHGPPDLSTVDDLARLALAVRRLGWSLRLRHPSGELSELLELAGLARVVAGPQPGTGEPALPGETDASEPATTATGTGAGEPPPRGGLGVQVGGEAKEAEEVGVEERVGPGDPVS
jgi:hypothetical protein